MSAETLTMLQNLLVLLIGAVSGPLARYLTALVKDRLGTRGVTTTVVSGVLSALVAGVFGYFAGAYGQGADGVIRAILATILAALTAAGAQKAAVVAGVKANVVSGLTSGPVPLNAQGNPVRNGLE